MMKYIVNTIAFISAFALTAFAGWNTDLFDGESKRWGYGYERAQQCYSSVVERARIGDPEPDGWETYMDITPRRWGSSWTLEETKDYLESRDEDLEWEGDIVLARARGWWANPSDLGGSTITNWLDDNDTGDGTGIDLWITNCFAYGLDELIADAGASTNWIQDDPHWGVVTHSNGWKYLDDVINPLTNYCSKWEQEIWGSNDVIQIETMRFYEEGSGTNGLASAIADAETNAYRVYESMGSAEGDTLCNYVKVQGSGDSYSVQRWAGGARITYKTIPTYSTVDIYAAAQVYSSHGWVTWSDSQVWHKKSTIDVQGSDVVVEIGPQDIGDVISWPASAAEKGWDIFHFFDRVAPGWPGALFMVRKFKVPNGFKYVEQP